MSCQMGSVGIFPVEHPVGGEGLHPTEVGIPWFGISWFGCTYVVYLRLSELSNFPQFEGKCVFFWEFRLLVISWVYDLYHSAWMHLLQ
jgi:hypothetical protein